MIRVAKIPSQLVFFLLIGASAAAAHILTVLNLVSYFHMAPLVANLIAFFIAFNISYLGHKHLTFSQLEEKQLSLPHFFLVASSAGIINELLYCIFLNFTTMHYLFALILVLALVAVYSFLLSRFWACR